MSSSSYFNMDYIFASVMNTLNTTGLFKVISYDIVCQWYLHL